MARVAAQIAARAERQRAGSTAAAQVPVLWRRDADAAAWAVARAERVDPDVVGRDVRWRRGHFAPEARAGHAALVLKALAHIVEHLAAIARDALPHARAEVVDAVRPERVLAVEVVVRAPVAGRGDNQRRGEGQPLARALGEGRRYRRTDTDEVVVAAGAPGQQQQQSSQRRRPQLRRAPRGGGTAHGAAKWCPGGEPKRREWGPLGGQRASKGLQRPPK